VEGECIVSNGTLALWNTGLVLSSGKNLLYRHRDLETLIQHFNAVSY
jgi:hypothetical protein